MQEGERHEGRGEGAGEDAVSKMLRGEMMKSITKASTYGSSFSFKLSSLVSLDWFLVSSPFFTVKLENKRRTALDSAMPSGHAETLDGAGFQSLASCLRASPTLVPRDPAACVTTPADAR